MIMLILNKISNVLLKVGFVRRYFWALFKNFGRLKMEWFVFLEPGVIFKIKPGSLVTIKKGSYIKSGVVFEAVNNGRIVLEENVSIGHYAYIGASSLVFLGKNTTIGQSCTLVDSAHIHDGHTPLDKSGYHYGQLILEDHVAVYPKATIGPNLRIATGTVIGAHAFVHRSIEKKNGLYVGMPAQRIRDI